MNRSLTLKLGAIALLILLLLIPLLMINGVIQERQQLRDGVLEDIARSSSYSQQLSGPLMVVPYRKTVRTWKTNEKTNQRYQDVREERGRLYFLPERFELDGQVQTELRARGIYEARLFHADNRISGHFSVPAQLGIKEDFADYRFDQPFLAVGISDIRGIENALKLELNDLLSFRRFAQTNVQFAQCLGIHQPRCLSHNAGSTLGFREGDYFTDRLGAGHQHHQTVQTEGQTTVRRRAVFQGVEQEAELLFLFRFADTQQTEHRLLHFLAVDTDRTATQFGAVQDHVVGTGQRGCRVGFQFLRRALRRGERVVQRGEAAVVVLFEHREVDNPHRCPLAGQQVQIVTNLDPQRAQGFADDLRFISAEEHDIAINCTDADRKSVV